MSHVPVRTCIGCRRQDAQPELLRLVREPTRGTVVVDLDRRLPGRGAWIHQNDGCIRAALSPARLGRALRCPVTVGNESIIETINSVTDNRVAKRTEDA